MDVKSGIKQALHGHYILDGHRPVPCDDLMQWCHEFDRRKKERQDPWRVALTKLDNADVSTVFLGLDHSFGDGPPELFETMIFGGEHHEFCERYSTWEAAEAGHARAVELVKTTS
jgi:hypothetical protein